MRKHYKIAIFIPILFVILSVGSVLLINHLTAPKISIDIDLNGRLYVKTNIDSENMYICWETDAGNIKPAVMNADLRYQPDNAYFCYTGANETALWDIEDYDGHNYSIATIRVYLYKYRDGYPSKYYLEKTISRSEITIEKVGGTVKMLGKRIFGNPVRADGQTEWSQIFPIYEHPSIVLLRYRTGTVIGKNDVIQWESKFPLLCQTEFKGLPLDSIKSLEGSNIIKKDVSTFLYFDVYRSILDENYNHETNSTTITVKAFIYDKKSKAEKYESRIVYSYNDVKKEHNKLNGYNYEK